MDSFKGNMIENCRSKDYERKEDFIVRCRNNTEDFRPKLKDDYERFS